MKITRVLFERIIFKISFLLCFWYLILSIPVAKAQSSAFFDSLDIAKTQLNQGEMKSALEILEILEKTHPGDENVIRLKGQALYWSKDFQQTQTYFQQSIQSYPSLQWIKLDFGRILFELGDLKESEEILKEFLLLQPDNPEALQKLAQINFWLGGKSSYSFAYLKKILDPYPENESALNLKKEIHQNRSPSIHVQSTYYSDTQIMQYLGLQATGELYHSALLQPGFLAEVRNYQNDASVLIAQVGLKSSFVKSRTDILLNIGLANSSLWETKEMIYEAEIRQKLPANLNLAASLDRDYYLYTLTSISQPINPAIFRSSIGREVGNSWIGQLLYQKSSFEDENWVQTIAAWILIPVIQTNGFQLSIGSTVNLSDSREVRFSENLPIINQTGNTAIESVIPGSYNPYFTPINQKTAGGLAKMEFDFSANFSLSLTGNMGFYGRIDNPNMIYYGTTPNPGNGQGNGQVNRPISTDDIYLVLIDQQFNPLDFKASIEWNLSPKTQLNMTYNYQETIFFQSNLFNFGLKTRFWND